MIKIQNLVSFIYILADAFDPEERIASTFSLKYHKDKGNDHYVKRLKVVRQIIHTYIYTYITLFDNAG